MIDMVVIKLIMRSCPSNYRHIKLKEVDGRNYFGRSDFVQLVYKFALTHSKVLPERWIFDLYMQNSLPDVELSCVS